MYGCQECYLSFSNLLTAEHMHVHKCVYLEPSLIETCLSFGLTWMLFQVYKLNSSLGVTEPNITLEGWLPIIGIFFSLLQSRGCRLFVVYTFFISSFSIFFSISSVFSSSFFYLLSPFIYLSLPSIPVLRALEHKIYICWNYISVFWDLKSKQHRIWI